MKKNYTIAVILMTVLAVSVCLADETLVGYWGFEEGEGGDAADMSGTGNDGVINGNAEWKPGKAGTALVFVKAGEIYVEIADSETLGVSDQITMSAWIKPSEIYVGGEWQERNCIVAKKRAYYLDISETGSLACYMYNVQPQEWLVGETDLTGLANTWIHIAATYDGNEQKLYVNGKLDASMKKSGAITVNNDNLTIGWVDNNRYFDGLIDEVQIWSRALTEDELAVFLSVEPKDKLATCWGELKQ
jgi:hypothetical protein